MAGRIKKAGVVTVDGLDELRRELRKLDDAGLTDELKDANKAVADLVVVRAQQNASTRMERRAASSLRSARQAARAQVMGGSAKVPFFGGAEFGSLRFTQFRPWTGSNSQSGYFLYPAIRESTEEIVEMYGDEIMKISAKAFPEQGVI
jgi:hypothetical protein